ncbi:unnamed protein product [Lactuca saligna]|uniref:Uncharacterized protein n=1 Tax=Lactuca saligna TaxID=75948 RepID=A0AA35Y0I6_LACSI|nr:unnamed protein product [Lactuca saligna]
MILIQANLRRINRNNEEASDAGVKTSGFETFFTTPPTSQPQDDPDIPLGADGLDFDTFHYSLFSVQGESDDDAPVTQRHIRALFNKLESLIASSTATSIQAYYEAAVKGMLNTLKKEHAINLEKANKSVEDSTLSLNDAITKLSTLLRIERENLEKLHTDINADNTSFPTSISSRLTKFQEDLAVESKIMDELALRTNQLISKSIMLKNVKK